MQYALEDNHLYVPENDYYILFLGGSTSAKKWSVANYYKIAEQVDKRTNYTCVLAGTAEEKAQEAYFLDRYLNFYSYIGKTNLEELQKLIENAKFVIGNDTSAIHMAAALGVPSVCVSSSASSNRFYPYDVDNNNGVAPICVKKDVPCKGNIIKLKKDQVQNKRLGSFFAKKFKKFLKKA